MYEQIARNKRRSVGYALLFVTVWLMLGAGIGWLFARLEASGSTRTEVSDSSAGAVIATVLALAAVLFTVRAGARFVLSVAGAEPADPDRYRPLVDLVAATAIGAGLRTPAVYVIEDESPNAFATGISPDRAAITVTTGLLAVMDREELEGVIGHELSHIRNYDTRLLLVVTLLIGMAGLLASLIWRSAFFVRGRGRSGEQTTLLVLAAGALLSVVGFIVGPLIRLAISRRRESLADVSGVELTRNPVGLIRALRVLQANDRPLAKTNHATAAMCIDNPLHHHEARYHQLFDTHPPLAERIAVLERIAAGLEV